MSVRNTLQRQVRRALLVVVAALLPALSLAAPIKTQGTWYGSNGWDGTLRGRDVAGNPISLLNATADAPNPDLKYVYDTQLNLTWLADWNKAVGSNFTIFGATTDGLMMWVSAKTWASSLLDFGGGWTLPTVLDTGAVGCDYGVYGTDCGYNVYGDEVGRRVSPLAHMYYDSLGNRGLFDVSGASPIGWGLKNTGPFVNMQSGGHWSGSVYGIAPTGYAWGFYNFDGSQDYSPDGGRFAVAVRPGDVLAGSVPEPGGLALLGLAFGMLAVVRRRGQLKHLGQRQWVACSSHERLTDSRLGNHHVAP